MARGGLLAAAVAVVVSGCGMESPEAGAVGVERSDLKVVAFNLPAVEECRTVSVRPNATGTVLSAPALNMIEVAPVGTAVESQYLSVTDMGPQQRRGIVEFTIPPLNGHLVSAHLSFTDSHNFVFQDVPADVHELIVYNVTDDAITAADFSREGAPFAVFSTDLNDLHPMGHSFDVLANVALGQGTGFRVGLQKTPPSTVVSAGSSFVDFVVQVKVCDESALSNNTFPGRPGPMR
jgi:hypothetical protein